MSRPKVLTAVATGTDMRHQYQPQQQPVLLVNAQLSMRHSVPDHGTNRCRWSSLGVGLSHDLVPNALGRIGTGLWLQPVPILRTLALGQASTQCRLVPKAKAPGADDLVPITWCRWPISTGSCCFPVPPSAHGKGTGCWWPSADDPVDADDPVGAMIRCRCATFCTGSLPPTGAFGQRL